MVEEPMVFVVNLAEDVERREAITRHLQSAQIQFQVFPAVDARTYNEEKLDELRRKEVISKDFCHSRGSLGCVLSHRAIYAKMVEEDIDLSVVLEDDSIPGENFSWVVEKVGGEIDDGEVVLLFYRNPYSARPYRPLMVSSVSSIDLGLGLSLAYPMRRNLHSTVAYMLTKATAARLLEVNNPIKYPADGWSRFHAEGALDAIRLVVPLCVKIGWGQSSRLAFEVNDSLSFTERIKGRLLASSFGIIARRQKMKIKRWRETRAFFTEEPSPLDIKR